MTVPPERRDDDAAWEAIVADLSGELDFSPVLGEHDPRPEPEHDPLDDEPEAFVPPEPPPVSLPADPYRRAGLAAIIGGPVIVIANRWLGLGSLVTLIGGAVFVAGIATLIARLRDERDDDHDITGGAVV